MSAEVTAIVAPPPAEASSSPNPFRDIAARNWLAETLWKNEPPRLRRPILFVGTEPFQPMELARFLQGYGIESRLGALCFDAYRGEPDPGNVWVMLSSAEPPIVVLGCQKVLDLELVSLLSDKMCADKEGDEGYYPFGLSAFPHWLNRISTETGKDLIQRSRTLKDIQFTSQEALLACLFSSCPSPEHLPPPWPAHLAGHPVLSKIPELRNLINRGLWPNWPGIAAEPGTGISAVGREAPSEIGRLNYSEMLRGTEWEKAGNPAVNSLQQLS